MRTYMKWIKNTLPCLFRSNKAYKSIGKYLSCVVTSAHFENGDVRCILQKP